MSSDEDPKRPVSDPQEPAEDAPETEEEDGDETGGEEGEGGNDEEAPLPSAAESVEGAPSTIEGQYRPIGGVGHLVNAFQWPEEGENPADLPEWFKPDAVDAEPGDWIVRAEDKVTVMKPEHFAQRYEAA